MDTPPETSNPQNPILKLLEPIYDRRIWLRIIAGWMFLNAIPLIISIIGILLCWIPIWIGILCLRIVDLLEHSVEVDAERVDELGEKTATLISILGILTLLYLVLIALGILLFIVFIMFAPEWLA